MDALQLLTGDHNRVRGLFKRFEDAEEGEDRSLMAELAAKIIEELEVHTTIEEEIFYPTVRESSEEVRELVDEGVEEHGVAKTLVEGIGALEAGGEEWIAKLKVLIENVKHHAEEEESEMFPAVRSAMDATELEGMAQQLEERKKALGAPTSEDTLDLTKEDLDEKAREQEIPGRSTMSRDELALTVDPQ